MHSVFCPPCSVHHIEQRWASRGKRFCRMLPMAYRNPGSPPHPGRGSCSVPGKSGELGPTDGSTLLYDKMHGADEQGGNPALPGYKAEAANGKAPDRRLKP